MLGKTVACSSVVQRAIRPMTGLRGKSENLPSFPVAVRVFMGKLSKKLFHVFGE
jgi:hypothetical protein